MPTVILPSTSAQGDLLYDDGTSANTFVTLPKSTTATRYLANTGTNNNPQWAQVDLSNGVTGTLAASNGGTGQSSYAVGDLLYATGTTSLSRLAAVAVGQVLVSGGVSTAPSWSATPTVSVLTAAEGRFQQIIARGGLH